MINCPHCKEATIDDSSKILASALLPVKCSNCDKFSGITGMFKGSYSAILEFLILYILALIFVKNFNPTIVLGLIIFSGMNILFGYFSKINPLTEKDISYAKIATFVAVLCGSLLFLLKSSQII